MLTIDEVSDLAKQLWLSHLEERVEHDRVYDYVAGKRGRPKVPDPAEPEIVELARLSVHNVLSLVRDSFTQNLVVTGFREPDREDDSPAWDLWQRNRMDARQHEIHRPAITYGASYCVVDRRGDRVVFMPRSPRQLFAVYEDPRIDEWPMYALDTWVEVREGKRVRVGQFWDSEASWRLDLGEVQTGRLTGSDVTQHGFSLRSVDEPVRHGAVVDGERVCPVVRFVNGRDAEDLIVGEIEPLIVLQEAINNVNFDRLIVSRFGAFPQKVITGWSAEAAEVLKASAKQVWAFEDPEVDTKAFPATNIEPYNLLVQELQEHVAMVAQISPAQVTGKMVNVSAEALAAGEANQQRKLKAKRDSFGESHEQMLRLGAALSGGDLDTGAGAEVVWRDTEARSFGAVVDGVSKLSQGEDGVPIEELLHLVPGLSQLQISKMRRAIRSNRTSSLLRTLPTAAAASRSDSQVGELASRTTAAGPAELEA